MAVIYFVFVAPLNKWRERQSVVEEPTQTEIDLLREIRDLLANNK